MKPLKIYLCNLAHPKTIREIAVPLGIACIASYCKKKYGNRVDVHLCTDAEELVKTIKISPPDILGFSFYMWNNNLTLETIKFCKNICPEAVVVLGGPNIARKTDRFKKLLEENESIDILVLDQGEICFADIVGRCLDLNAQRTEVLKHVIPGSALRDQNSGEILRGEEVPQHALNVLELPSPYLSGLLNKFLIQGGIPAIETNRGCPFTCKFCTQSDAYYTKLQIFDENTVLEELKYIHKLSPRKELIITDNNFGILGERDIRIAKFILKMYEDTGFPLVWAYSSSKVKTPENIEVMKIMAQNTGIFTLGIQTLTEPVLKLSARKNLSYQDLQSLGQYAEQENIRITADMIFGLPGETVKSFFDSISQVVKLGVKAPQTRNLKMIPGSPIADFEREKHDYVTKFRIIGDSFGEYALTESGPKKRIVEVEEIAYSSNSFTENDFVHIRQYVFLLELLLSYGGYSYALQFLTSRGLNVSDIFQYIILNYKYFPCLRKLMELHWEYAKSELFNSAEELIHDLTCDDQTWNDLMMNQGRFFKMNIAFSGYALLHNNAALDDICSLILEFSGSRLASNDLLNLEEVIKQDELLRLVKIYKNDDKQVLCATDVQEEIIIKENYDFRSWAAKGFIKDISEYAFGVPKTNKLRIRNFKKLLNAIEINKNYSCLCFYERIVLGMSQDMVRRYGDTES